MLRLSCTLLSRPMRQKRFRSKNFSAIRRVEFYNCNKISDNPEQSELEGRVFETADVSHVTRL